MRFVIYDDESLEPITVINLPGWTERDIMQRCGGFFRLPIMEREWLTPQVHTGKQTEYAPMRTVEIRFERFRRGNQETIMAFTKQADLAMLLNPAWLPGQRFTIDDMDRERDALVRLLDMVLGGR